MSFLTKLSLDDTTHEILHFCHSINRGIDNTGHPSTIPVGGTIDLDMHLPKNSDAFFKWMTSRNTPKSGTITNYRIDTMAVMTTLTFKEAYCYDFHVKMATDGNPYCTLQLKLSAKKLQLNEASLNKNWPISLQPQSK
jgi:hypothetical protein